MRFSSCRPRVGSGHSRNRAPAAMATIVVALNKQSPTIVRYALWSVTEWILTALTCGFYKSPDVVLGCRIRTSSLREGQLFHAPPVQQPWEAIVSFDAARLVINSVLPVALLGEHLCNFPWPRPHGGIFDRHDVFERGRRGKCPALDHLQVLARALKIGLRAEVRHVDNGGVAVPIAPRISVPLAEVAR